MKPINELLNGFNLKANNVALFEKAFTHSSFNADAKTKHNDYERLEFLGDSVIGLVVTEVAYLLHPELSQGPLTKLKSSLVSTRALAKYARKFNFPEYIRVGNSFSNDISKSDHILEDVFESFIGAVYLDQGFGKAHKVVSQIFYEDIKNYHQEDSVDYKSKLQEEMQAEHRESVTYEVVNETGPAHDKHFVVRVCFDGIELGVGEGSTKKSAEQMAAKQALEKEASK